MSFLYCCLCSVDTATSSSVPTSTQKITVALSIPSPLHTGSVDTETHTFGCPEEFHRLCLREGFGFFDPETNQTIHDYGSLVSGHHYFANGRRINAIANQQTTQHIESIRLECMCGLAVLLSLGANTRIHFGVPFTTKDVNDKVINHEYDAIVVHVSQATTAYIVESASSPLPDEVDKLLTKVETFRVWAATSDHFKTVTEFVPVLGGRLFPEETIAQCIARNVSRVAPTGTGYEWIRVEARDPMIIDGLCDNDLQMSVEGSTLREEELTGARTISRHCRSCLRAESMYFKFRVVFVLLCMFSRRSHVGFGTGEHWDKNRPPHLSLTSMQFVQIGHRGHRAQFI